MKEMPNSENIYLFQEINFYSPRLRQTTNYILYQYSHIISSVQFSSVTQSCPTLCDPMNHSMPGLPVHHQLLEFTQTHVH